MGKVELVQDNMKLVGFVIKNKKLNIPFHIQKDMRDLYQEGYILLIKAANKFDESKGYEFSTYAVNTIYLGLRSFLDRDAVKRYKYQGLSLEYEFENDEGRPNKSQKYLLESLEDGYSKVMIEDLLKKTKIKDIDKLVNMKMNKYTLEEIKEELQVKESEIYRRLNKFKDVIRKS